MNTGANLMVGVVRCDPMRQDPEPREAPQKKKPLTLGTEEPPLG